VLDPESRDFLRRHKLALAYDPVQEGWLPAGCVDDLADPPADTDPAGELSAAALARLEAEAFFIAQRARRNRVELQDARARLWQISESIVRELGNHCSSVTQIRSIRYLQRTAARYAVEQFGPSARLNQVRERSRTLISGLKLRPWRESDVPRFVELLDDPRVWAHLPENYPDPLTRDLAADLIELANTSTHHEVFAIEHDGAAIGQVRLSFEGLGTHADPEISYWLGVPYWGAGLASAIVPMYTLESFERHRITSVFARVADGNRASSRALEKAFYEYEGPHVAYLAGEPGIRTYRCFRFEYLMHG
jgi:RimJ/RimL family protein N-acetyltransferase